MTEGKKGPWSLGERRPEGRRGERLRCDSERVCLRKKGLGEHTGILEREKEHAWRPLF